MLYFLFIVNLFQINRIFRMNLMSHDRTATHRVRKQRFILKESSTQN